MSQIKNVRMECEKEEYSRDEDVRIIVKFSVVGDGRDSFNESNWTESYNANDVAVKIKYGVRLVAGGIRKKELGKPIDTYKRAAIFWTRNPKLVNPMKEKRVWVQVAKNFTPVIRMSEEEVRQELFDFEESYTIKASELGSGTHTVSGDVHVSWQKHHFLKQTSIKGNIQGIEVRVR